MTEMIICGMSMEMELAREMGTIGKCEGCLYLENNGVTDLCKGEVLDERKINCKDWVVDHR